MKFQRKRGKDFFTSYHRTVYIFIIFNKTEILKPKFNNACKTEKRDCIDISHAF